MNKVKFYKNNGDLDHEELLNEENLAHTNGMLLKCLMKDGTKIIGYADPYRTHDKESFDNEIHDYIYLWIWDNIDEETHTLVGNENSKYNQTFQKVNILDIKNVEAILHSNPRWGGKITNKFEFHKANEPKENIIEIPSFLLKGSDSNDD